MEGKMMKARRDQPPGLRSWFVIHFVVDMLFGLPLLFFPQSLMQLFGWSAVDPLMPRLVGAALLAIGGESLLGRSAGDEAMRALLNLKIIWATGALLAIVLALFNGAPPAAWLFLVLFALFLAVWVSYRMRLQAG